MCHAAGPRHCCRRSSTACMLRDVAWAAIPLQVDYAGRNYAIRKLVEAAAVADSPRLRPARYGVRRISLALSFDLSTCHIQ
jgi:hypothetical protein